MQALLSNDGYTYLPGKGVSGLEPGLMTFGVVQPQEKIRSAQSNSIWDCIVIGAGYTGLIAARDLVKAGEQALY